MNSASFTQETTNTLARLDDMVGQVRSLMNEHGDKIKQSLRNKKKEAEALRILDKGNDGAWIVFIEYDGDEMKFPPHEVLSDKFCGEFGYDRKELSENNWDAWRSIIDASELTEVDRQFMEHLQKGKEFKMVLRYNHKDGSRVKILARCDFVKDDRGRPSIVYGTHTNLTKLGL